MSFSNETNCHHRFTIIIDTFDDGTKELVKCGTDYVHPPCQTGGCRACDFETEACGYDPKTGLCMGRMA